MKDSDMSSVLLLQLVALYLIHLSRGGLLPAPGSDVEAQGFEELGTSGGRGGGGSRASSDGQGAVPNCRDGMKRNARERLVKAIKSKNPKLTYSCGLAQQALLEARGSSGRVPHHGPSDGTEAGMGSSFGLLFQRPRRDDYKPRKFVGDAVKDWEKHLQDAKSANRFGCGLKQTEAEYLLVCFFE